MDIWVVYSYSLYFSDQLLCIKFFHWSYGLKDIDFQSFIQFKRISGFLLFIYSTLSRTVSLTKSTDRGAHLSYTWSV